MTHIITKFILTLPIIIIFGCAALGIAMYVLQTFDAAQLMPPLGLFWAVDYVFESISERLEILSSNDIIGILLFLFYWVVSFLVGGIFFRPDDIHWPLKGLYQGMSFSYYIRNMSFTMNHKSTFASCDPVTNLSSPICIESSNGLEILKALEKLLPVIKDPSPLYDTLIILGMTVVFKALYVAVFYWKARVAVAFSQHQEASVDTTNNSKTSIEMGKRLRERECKTLVDGLEL